MNPRTRIGWLAGWFVLCFAGIAAGAGEHAREVPQDPALRITTAEILALFAKEFGDQPLVKEVLDKNRSFLLIDARPQVRYDEGHVPGAVGLPMATLEQNLDQLPKDRTLIFYCSGLTCPLSSEAAQIAARHGFNNIRVWYEGAPQWAKSGNYLITTTAQVKRLVESSDREAHLLIDARPPALHQKAFIPGSLSIPWALFEKKQGLLPADRNTPLVFYCGGQQCELSHQAAAEAKKLGYARVYVYAAGFPEWTGRNYAVWGSEAGGAVAAEPKKPAAAGALPETIAPEEFKALVGAGGLALVDTRSEREYREGHIPGAISIPDGEFYKDLAAALKKLPTDRRLAFYCSTGARSAGVFFAVTDDPEAYRNPHGVQYLNNNLAIGADGRFRIE